MTIPTEVILLADASKRLQTNEDYKLITDKIRKEMFTAFSKTNVTDIETREEIHRISYALDLIDKRIEKFISVVQLHADEPNE